jgi:tetratricopeptide (TPR) repeat protein
MTQKNRKNKEDSPGKPPDSQRRGRLARIVNPLILVLSLGCMATAVFLYIRRADKGSETVPERKADDKFVERELQIEESAKAYNERAVQVAQRLVKEFPGRAEPLLLLGQVHYEQEKYSEAVGVWEQGLRINASQPAAYQAMGSMALQEGDYEAAIAHWRKAIEVEPEWPGARRAIGLALMHLQRIEEAIPELEQDLKISPDASQAHFLLGQAYFQLEKLEEARGHYEAAIQEAPRFTSAYYALFRVLTRLRETNAAKEALAKFQDLKAGEQKAKREGEEAYDDMVAQRGALARTYDRAGMVFWEYGNIPKAMDNFRVAAHLDPKNIVSRLHLASLYERQGDLEEAVHMYEEIALAHPQDARPHLSIGSLYTRAAKIVQAEKGFQRAIQVDPEHPVAYYELARLYMLAGMKLDVAETLAEKVVELAPIAGNYDLLGWIYHLNGKSSEAEAAASKAVQLQPENQIYRNHHDTIRAKREQ